MHGWDGWVFRELLMVGYVEVEVNTLVPICLSGIDIDIVHEMVLESITDKAYDTYEVMGSVTLFDWFLCKMGAKGVF